jgi:hypothetical protein
MNADVKDPEARRCGHYKGHCRIMAAPAGKRCRS